MGKELLFQRLEDVSQLFLSSQSSSITIVPSSNARDSKLFQQDWLFFLQQVYSSQPSIKIQTEMGWMGILKCTNGYMLLTFIYWEVNAPLKPRCICCKDIFRLWLLGPKLSSITIAEGFWSSGSGSEVKAHCFMSFEFFYLTWCHVNATRLWRACSERDDMFTRIGFTSTTVLRVMLT